MIEIVLAVWCIGAYATWLGATHWNARFNPKPRVSDALVALLILLVIWPWTAARRWQNGRAYRRVYGRSPWNNPDVREL